MIEQKLTAIENILGVPSLIKNNGDRLLFMI